MSKTPPAESVEGIETFKKSLNIRAIGFCGADDTVAPGLLQLLSWKYNWIEWGVIFGCDREGPRHPSKAWVDELVRINKAHGSKMQLAAHLCQMRCRQVLEGDPSFVIELQGLGFGRVQINATTALRAITCPEQYGKYAAHLRSTIESVRKVEFIFQLNDETKPVCDILSVDPPANMSILFDASCGLGVEITALPNPHSCIPCGYAGGIGPLNIKKILEMVSNAEQPNEKMVWLDMESSLRGTRSDKYTSNQNYFSIDKCFACVCECVSAGMPVYDPTVK